MDATVKHRTMTRRLFLRILGWGSFFATIGISIAGAVRFLYPRVLFEEPSIFKIGFRDDFKPGEETGKNHELQVYEKWKKEESVWIVREGDRIYAMPAQCTHLGCTPDWFADEQVFKCPCHGSRFKSNGENFAGPAPRPLDRMKIFIDNDGSICIDKSRVYTFKEFDRPGAYVKIS